MPSTLPTIVKLLSARVMVRGPSGPANSPVIANDPATVRLTPPPPTFWENWLEPANVGEASSNANVKLGNDVAGPSITRDTSESSDGLERLVVTWSTVRVGTNADPGPVQGVEIVGVNGQSPANALDGGGGGGGGGSPPAATHMMVPELENPVTNCPAGQAWPASARLPGVPGSPLSPLSPL